MLQPTYFTAAERVLKLIFHGGFTLATLLFSADLRLTKQKIFTIIQFPFLSFISKIEKEFF